MIVRVEFIDDRGETYKMMFGDSYKSWSQQYREYRRTFPQVQPVKAWKSRSKWKSWGGLKWCSELQFQQELNREGCQQNNPDNKSPRRYPDMVFSEIPLKDLTANKY